MNNYELGFQLEFDSDYRRGMLVCIRSHRAGKLNNSKWPLSTFSRAMTIKTSIPLGHKAL
jgi:hypothetical protein